MTMPPWLFALAVIYAVSISWWCGYLLLGDIQRRRRLKQQPDTIMAVADAALAEQPHLADDAEAVAQTVLALEEVAELRRLARADGEAAAFVTPGTPRADAFLAVMFPRTKGAPKERP
jgi:hypothetical protein